MEQVANTMLFACKYSIAGCQITMLAKDKPSHEEICEHRPYSCPWRGAGFRCKWRGIIEQVMSHLLKKHYKKYLPIVEGDCVGYSLQFRDLEYIFRQPTPYFFRRPIVTRILSCFDHQFVVVYGAKKNRDGRMQFVASVRLIGTPKQAENFTYKLELSGNRRKMTWKATMRSIRESLESIMSKSDCIVLDENGTRLFMDNDVLSGIVNVSLRTTDGAASGMKLLFSSTNIGHELWLRPTIFTAANI